MRHADRRQHESTAGEDPEPRIYLHVGLIWPPILSLRFAQKSISISTEEKAHPERISA